jgi:putative protease
MAPAGDWDCAKAAVENGADAVYFGLQGGLNARARAVNFTPAELPELMAFLRARGVRGYLTLNTLVFPDELDNAERTARAAVAAGVDAVLVQDLGLLRLLHRLCPELPLHASTQMTLSSAECIRQVESLGVRRVVLPRELSIAEIAAIHRQTDVELEAFVHGALCISYSGQCLASLTLGGRSANRGQCAQPCRLPYELVVDGQTVDLGEKKYLLSPHDLAAYDRLPELIAAGVAAVKIEGRLKTAEYVAGVTANYRAAIDAVCGAAVPAGSTVISQAGRPHHKLGPQEVAEMESAFSRGFCHGWLDGNDPKALVSGTASGKRGVCLGEVEGVSGQRVRVWLAAPVRRGDGIVFEADRSEEAQQGGRVYEIFRGRQSVVRADAGESVVLTFGRDALDAQRLCVGQQVWKTDDPQLQRRLRKTYSGRPRRRVPLDVTVEAAVGSPLRIAATLATGAACRLETPQPLAEALKHPLTIETLTEQLSRLGATTYELRRLDARITGRPMVPLSVLGKLRHEMIERLEAAAAGPPERVIAAEPVLPLLRAEARGLCVEAQGGSATATPTNVVGTLRVPTSQTGKPYRTHTCRHTECADYIILCRSIQQLAAAMQCGASSIIGDFRDPADCGEAVRIARAGGAKIILAAPRIHKPGENGILRQLAECQPDGMLVRNLAGLAFCRERGLSAIADFSLNAANELTVAWLHAQGAERVALSYDLSGRQLLDLAAAVPAEWIEVVVQRHTPLFHSAHCLFCALLTPGRDQTDCGRPCRRQDVRLRDRRGVEHPLLADSQCRNTLFHAEAQSAAEWMPPLLDRGVRHFRVELLAETSLAEVRRVLSSGGYCHSGK